MDNDLRLELYVDDIERSFAFYTNALGFDVSPLKTQDWGLRDFRVLDPDGYYLRITTPRPRSPGAS
jgi:lactoylglutathione lyase